MLCFHYKAIVKVDKGVNVYEYMQLDNQVLGLTLFLMLIRIQCKMNNVFILVAPDRDGASLKCTVLD